jgi:hypothetical protein
VNVASENRAAPQGDGLNNFTITGAVGYRLNKYYENAFEIRLSRWRSKVTRPWHRPKLEATKEYCAFVTAL